MKNNIPECALQYLYKQLKKARIDLGRAEYKGVADEIANLQTKIEVLEWLTSVAVKEVK